MAGNVLVGGIIGAGVDMGTGAMLDLVPNPINVALEPTGSTPTSAQAVASAAPTALAAPAATQAVSRVAPATAPAAAPVATSALAPLPTQTQRLPGHRLAAYGCPGFAPRVLYSESQEKLPKNCERIVPL